MMVPLKFTLEPVRRSSKAVPLLLVDLLNEDGVTGRAYAFCYRPSGRCDIVASLRGRRSLKGKDSTPFDVDAGPFASVYAARGDRSLRMALSLLDMAMWDANRAQMQRVPLSSLLGSSRNRSALMTAAASG